MKASGYAIITAQAHQPRRIAKDVDKALLILILKIPNGLHWRLVGLINRTKNLPLDSVNKVVHTAESAAGIGGHSFIPGILLNNPQSSR